MRAQIQEQAFCYLHADFPRSYPFTRFSQNEVRLTLPDLRGIPVTHTIPFDARDRRAMIVFDGEVPWSGVGRMGRQHAVFDMGILTCTHAHLRRNTPFELHGPYAVNETGAAIMIRRRVLLVRGGTYVVMRYRPPSFGGWYAFITVTMSDKGCEVTFQNNDQ